MQPSAFRALGHYRVLPKLVPTYRLFIAAAARVPYAMIPLGAVTGVTWASNNIALGGRTTALIALSSAIASPFWGRLSDRLGIARLLHILWPLSLFATLWLLLVTISNTDSWMLYAAALAVGSTMIPVGALTRARWIALHPDPRTMSTAFSYETMVDEFMFVIGPVFVGLTSVYAGWAPLAVATALIFLIVGTFTWENTLRSACSASDAHHTQDEPIANLPSESREATDAPLPRISTVLWSIAPIIGTMIAMGTIFGTTQTGLTERALSLGQGSQAGLWYGLMGIGSAIISILAVVIPDRITAPARIGAGALLLTGTMHFASHLESLAGTGALLLLSGLGMGIVLVTSFANAEHLCPPRGTAVAMTAMPASITIGVSLGSLAGGSAALYGSHAAFHWATGAAFFALICSMWLTLHLRTSRG